MPDVEGIGGAQLKSFIERIERLEEEKQALGERHKGSLRRSERYRFRA
jgi:uncharacterized protein (UPF0335 family)